MRRLTNKEIDEWKGVFLDDRVVWENSRWAIIFNRIGIQYRYGICLINKRTKDVLLPIDSEHGFCELKHYELEFKKYNVPKYLKKKFSYFFTIQRLL